MTTYADGALGRDEALRELVALSRAYGSDPELVTAGGGNTSVKLGDRLLVKPSGVALVDISADDFVELDRNALEALLQSDLGGSRPQREAAFKDAVMAARVVPGRGRRPSVESLLHHLVPDRFVVHLHATVVNQFSCSVAGQQLIGEHLGADVVWVELVDPGFVLAKVLQEKLRAFRERNVKPPRAIIMQNHGLVLSGATPEEVESNLRWLLGSLQEIRDRTIATGAPGAGSGPGPGGRARAGDLQPSQVEEVQAALLSALSADDEPLEGVTFDASDVVTELVTSPEGRDLAMGGPLTPDQIVYCQSFPLWLEAGPREDGADLASQVQLGVQNYVSEHHVRPKVVLVEGVGLFSFGRSQQEADTACLVYVDAIKVMQGARALGGVHYLDEDFRTFIEQWEVESYRRQLRG